MKIAIAAFCGLVLGALGMSVLHAQAKPPAYYIGEHIVSDPAGFKVYASGVPKTLEQHGGKFVVRGAQATTLEGEAPKGRIVVLAFENMDKAKAWYDSQEYQALKAVRLKAATSKAILVEGLGN